MHAPVILRVHQVSLPYWTIVESVSPSYTPWSPQIQQKFSLASQYLLYSWWSTAVLHGCRRNVVCMFTYCHRMEPVAQNFSHICNLLLNLQCFMWQLYSAYKSHEVCITTGRWLICFLLRSLEASQCVGMCIYNWNELNWQEVISKNWQIKLISL